MESLRYFKGFFGKKKTVWRTWGLEIMGGKKMDESVRSGVGAGFAVLFGTTAKFAIGVIIWFIVAVAAFWP